MLTSTAKLLYLTLLASQVLASTRSFGGVNMDDIRNLEIDHLVKSNPKGIQKLFDTFGGLLESRIQEELYNKIVGIVTNALLSADSVVDVSNSTALPETPTPENHTTEVPKVPTTEGGVDPTTQAGPHPTTEGNGGGPCFPPGSCDDPTTEAGGRSCIELEIQPTVTLTICVDGTEICIEVKVGPVPLEDECFDLSDIELPFPKDCPFSIPIPLPGDILTYLGQQTFAPLEPLVDLPPLPFLPTALPETIGNISSECIFSELQFVLDLVCSPRELYAFQMFDAMGKMPSGLLKGDLRWLGSFMQCRDIEDVENWLPFLEANSTYDAHYCLTTWQITTSEEANATKIPLQIGVCFPELCSQHDISTLLQFAFSAIFSDMFELESTFCEYDTPRDALGTAFLAIVLTLSALTVIGSTIDYLARVRYQRDPEDVYKINGDVTSYDNNAYDVQETPHAGIEMTETTNPDPKEKMTLENAMEKVEPQKDETENEESETLPTKSEKVAEDNVSISESKFARYSSPIRAFSGFINGSKIFSTDYDRDDPNHPLMALHGMRVLTLWWVIYQMTYETSYEVLQNPLDLLWISERFHSQAISNGSFATDTFFVISGFLITYLALKKLDEHGSSWKMWLTYYFHRVWRFWPAYIVILLMYMWALPNMVGGPLSYIANDYVQPCYTYWWTNVIFINNLHPYFDPLRDKCMPWSWYIACVMQFYIISPCIILLLHWKR
ncbi:O-acyltransferase like protein-like [Ptychodera flava]|uniref:O-acyltransferase like protein-like n=1 Tax=Ptychodera flava TaxID=63121 RepID=UPI003969D5D4